MASLAHRGGVDGDTVDSGGQTGKLAELVNFGDEGKKHVLGDLFGIHGISENGTKNPHDPLLVSPQEMGQGLGVAGADLAN